MRSVKKRLAQLRSRGQDRSRRRQPSDRRFRREYLDAETMENAQRWVLKAFQRSNFYTTSTHGSISPCRRFPDSKNI